MSVNRKPINVNRFINLVSIFIGKANLLPYLIKNLIKGWVITMAKEGKRKNVGFVERIDGRNCCIAILLYC